MSDRSKPYVGAMITLSHYHKFGDLWIVELLYPSLLMWLKWIVKSRVDTNGLVFLASDNLPRQYSDGAQCSTTAAKWESGLDNSPMYVPDTLLIPFVHELLFSLEVTYHRVSIQ